jgi:hypothetical protein
MPRIVMNELNVPVAPYAVGKPREDEDDFGSLLDRRKEMAGGSDPSTSALG